jgi:hypothetical protein
MVYGPSSIPHPPQCSLLSLLRNITRKACASRPLHSVSLSSGLQRIEGLYSPASNGAGAPALDPIQIDLSPYRSGTYLLRIQHLTGTTTVHRIIRQ